MGSRYSSETTQTLQVGDSHLEFVLIRPGAFTMGSHRGLPTELPTRRVRIDSAFFLSRYPVTQAVWRAVMGQSPACFVGDVRLPVDGVSWDDAQTFLARASNVTGARLRLPSEAEWEYACRAGSDAEYFFGDDAARVGEFAWYAANSEDRTHPVGLKKPNDWGLYDMTGNVWEWCEDVWHADYVDAPADAGSVETPLVEQ